MSKEIALVKSKHTTTSITESKLNELDITSETYDEVRMFIEEIELIPLYTCLGEMECTIYKGGVIQISGLRYIGTITTHVLGNYLEKRADKEGVKIGEEHEKYQEDTHPRRRGFPRKWMNRALLDWERKCMKAGRIITAKDI